jgi:hypothetical protein
MWRRVITACALAALVVVPSASPQVVVGRTAFRAVLLPAGAVKALSIACPRGYLAVSSGAAEVGAGVTVLEDRPLGARTFRLRLLNGADAAQRATAVASCRRVRYSGRKSPYLRLSALRHVTVTVAPSTQRQAHLTCPSGTVPAAAGFDLGRSNLVVQQETQDLHVLTFAVFNGGMKARAVSFYGSCLTVVRPAGAPATQLQVSLATDTVPIHNGSQVVTRICPAGSLALGVGYSLPVGIELNGAAAVARTGRWSLTNSAEKPVLAQLQLACTKLS